MNKQVLKADINIQLKARFAGEKFDLIPWLKDT
jgi:hypothetical protein